MIAVLGSLNIDLTVTIPRFHAAGETITGTSFGSFTGGKGGNQAVAAAKLGASVYMAGRLGCDGQAEQYRRVFDGLGVSHCGVWTDEALSSGTALIEVDAAGENRIVIVPGANGAVSRAQVDALMPELCKAEYVLMQLEIPLDTVCYAAAELSARGARVILDPAPAVPLPDGLLSHVAYITPNETELALLTGMSTASEAEARTAAQSLLKRGANAVICKRGAKGAMLVTSDGCDSIPGFKVEPVDTTAAGDSFNAGFAVALERGYSPREAVRAANAVGALSTLAKGAQGAMPSWEAALGLLN